MFHCLYIDNVGFFTKTSGDRYIFRDWGENWCRFSIVLELKHPESQVIHFDKENQKVIYFTDNILFVRAHKTSSGYSIGNETRIDLKGISKTFISFDLVLLETSKCTKPLLTFFLKIKHHSLEFQASSFSLFFAGCWMSQMNERVQTLKSYLAAVQAHILAGNKRKQQNLRIPKNFFILPFFPFDYILV